MSNSTSQVSVIGRLRGAFALENALKLIALMFLLAIISAEASAQARQTHAGAAESLAKDNETYPRPMKFRPDTAIQHKSCPIGAPSCSFDHPLTDGDMIAVVEKGGGCILLPGNSNCNTVSDSQRNVWQIAIVVPENDGTPLWFALNASQGYDTIYFAPGSNWGAIIAEYPPALWLEDANYGLYGRQVLHGDDGVSSDHGFTLPVVTNYASDLLLVWANSEAPSTDGIATPDPGFTVEETQNHAFALADSIAATPWIYMGSMHWTSPSQGDVYTHWTMGIAAFRMGSLYTVRNPSFEDSGTLPDCWNNGPIPFWDQSGDSGLIQPSRCGLNWPVPDGITMARVGNISQNIGPVSAGTYTMTSFVGIPSGESVFLTMAFSQNGASVCAKTIRVPGAMTLETLSCSVPAGDLVLSLSIPTGWAYVDDVKFRAGS